MILRLNELLCNQYRAPAIGRVQLGEHATGALLARSLTDMRPLDDVKASFVHI